MCEFACQDFGDGGAYPEIHVAQFPMGLGQQNSKSGASSNALAKQVDADGKIKYDVIARHGHAQDKASAVVMVLMLRVIELSVSLFKCAHLALALFCFSSWLFTLERLDFLM